MLHSIVSFVRNNHPLLLPLVAAPSNFQYSRPVTLFQMTCKLVLYSNRHFHHRYDANYRQRPSLTHHNFHHPSTYETTIAQVSIQSAENLASHHQNPEKENI